MSEPQTTHEGARCRQYGNLLTEKDVQQGAQFCDHCWRVRADYHYMDNYDEFEEDENEIYICEFCGGEYSYDGGWSTCDCSERWGDGESHEGEVS